MTTHVGEIFSFGTWVRRRRKALDLTQAALAKRVNCAEITIRKLEADALRPSRQIAERLADYLDIPAADRARFLQIARGDCAVDQLLTLASVSNVSPPALEGVPTSEVPLPLDTVPQPALLPAGSRMPLSRNPLFVGRDADLRQLAQALHVGTTAAIGHREITAATGLGGIGKTQLACEFVHRYGQYFAGGVFWLSFADPAAVPAEVAACGGADGMQLRPAFGTLPLDEQVKLVLTAWETPLRRLLVFDNCEEETLLQQWRPKHGGCRVLVTSRRRRWDVALGVRSMPLDVLSRSESMLLLRAFRPDLPADDNDLQAIAETLGDLPLALHLAGSFLAKYRYVTSPAQYWARLQAPTLLDDRSLQAAGLSPTEHVQHVARTFEQSYEQLDPTDPTDALALRLLAHAACFAPGEPIPRWLLVHPLALGNDAEVVLAVEDALIRAIDLGLLETDAAGSLRLHRLVTAFVQAVSDYSAAQTVVEATMLRVADELNQTYNPRPLLAIEPHLRCITEAAQKRADADAAALSNALGVHLLILGIYPEAQAYLEQAVVIRQQVLQADHLLTADSLNNVGQVLWTQGQYAKAQRYFEQAVAIRLQVLGTHHPDTARSLCLLGVVLWEQGQYVRAWRYLEQAVTIRLQVLQINHSGTDNRRTTQNRMLWAQSWYAEAQGYLEQKMPLRLGVLGADHPLVIQTPHDLAVLLDSRGHDSAAPGYLGQALAMAERALGLDDPDAATCLSNLAFVLQALGRYAEAQRYFEQAQAMYRRMLGPDHHLTARGLNNLLQG